MSGVPVRPVTTVGGYLGARLRQIGVEHIFGLPGDFSMSLLDELLATGLAWVGATNELNAAYAADGYARRRSLGVVVTTFGVGELSALPGVAGAYAESVPLVHVTGAPPTAAAVAGTPLHHTLLDGDFGHFARAYREVTAVTEVLRVDTAAAQIDRALQAALDELRPVNITIPRDVATATLDASSRGRLARPLHPRASDPEALGDLRAALPTLLDAHTEVTTLVGRLAVRRRLGGLVRSLADSGVRVATLLDAKGILDETHPSSLGSYVGAFTARPDTLDAVEHADCLVLVGAVLSDLVSGNGTSRLKPAIELDLHEAHVGDLVLPGVELADALALLGEVLSGRDATVCTPLKAAPPTSRTAREDEPLTHARLWAEVQAWLPEDALLVADTGSAYFGAAGLRLPRGAELVGEPAWAAIGYTIPALLGLALGGQPDEQRRPVLIVGDGAAQLTVQELTTILARRVPAVVLLLDNGGYTVERLIHAPDAPYQDIVGWDWAALVSALAPHDDVRATRVASVGVLRAALDVANREPTRFHFLHLQLPRDDAPPLLASIAAGLATP